MNEEGEVSPDESAGSGNEGEVERFREFLDQIDPEDFAI
jgi:hypothetical protein